MPHYRVIPYSAQNSFVRFAIFNDKTKRYMKAVYETMDEAEAKIDKLDEAYYKKVELKLFTLPKVKKFKRKAAK